jgi:Ca-activated chloride channel family protein
MSFLWPSVLWLALLLPLLVGGYVWVLRRRKRHVWHHPSVALVKAAVGPQTAWKRHVPPALLLLALATLVLAGSRPHARVTLPTQQSTLMLVMDVSLSMMATDVAPDRINAAQEAARSFVRSLPAHTRIGVVAYGGTAHLVQPPTLDRDAVVEAIDRFQLQRGTAIGSGLAVALATLFPDAGIDVARLGVPRHSSRDLFRSGLGDDLPPAPTPVPPGSNAHAAVVLMTDGENNAGVDPMQAAQMAADRGVKVFTVGFGSRAGTVVRFEGMSVRVRLDEDLLRRMADLTLAQYHHAVDGTDLKNVYDALRSRLIFETKPVEVTAVLALLAGLLMAMAASLSLWWYGRVA